MPHVHQHRRGFEIEVCQIVMDRQEVSHKLSGLCVERDQRVAEEIFPLRSAP
jgi:hypothetical protein